MADVDEGPARLFHPTQEIAELDDGALVVDTVRRNLANSNANLASPFSQLRLEARVVFAHSTALFEGLVELEEPAVLVLACLGRGLEARVAQRIGCIFEDVGLEHARLVVAAQALLVGAAASFRFDGPTAFILAALLLTGLGLYPPLLLSRLLGGFLCLFLGLALGT